MGRALDAWWESLERPDPFVVVEAGAGTGTLARDLLAAGPRCAEALRYVLVERSAALRAVHRDRLPVEPPAWVLGPVGAPASGEDEPRPLPGSGPLVTSLAELPAVPVTGVVVANELLDNLPPVLLEHRGGAWHEVRIGDGGGHLAELLVPAAPAIATEAHRFVPDPPDTGRIPLQHAAASWLRRALSLLERGRVVVVDHADATPSLARRPWRHWLRTYRRHGRGGHPLEEPGTQDVTCEVAVDQLARVRVPSCDRSQAEFLRTHGIDGLVDQARAGWEERAHLGDLVAVRARSRVHEGTALVDPAGLGAFRVLEWELP